MRSKMVKRLVQLTLPLWLIVLLIVCALLSIPQKILLLSLEDNEEPSGFEPFDTDLLISVHLDCLIYPGDCRNPQLSERANDYL